ncbi:MAG: hypothetical protein ACI802_002136, partial [Candidatus Paceibacteria bacterium]
TDLCTHAREPAMLVNSGDAVVHSRGHMTLCPPYGSRFVA